MTHTVRVAAAGHRGGHFTGRLSFDLPMLLIVGAIGVVWAMRAKDRRSKLGRSGAVAFLFLTTLIVMLAYEA